MKLRDQRGAGFDELIAHERAHGVCSHLLEQRECLADIQQPEALEVGAEERARGPQHVVLVGILSIARRQRTQNALGELAMRRVAAQGIQRGGVYGAFGGP